MALHHYTRCTLSVILDSMRCVGITVSRYCVDFLFYFLKRRYGVDTLGIT